MARTMQALVLTQDGNATDHTGVSRGLSNPADYLALQEVPVPEPGPGEVVIRVRRSTVNPSDVAFVQGSYGQPRQKGAPAGFEGVGRVVAGRGLLARALTGRDVGFYVAPGGSGAWAEYARTGATSAIPLQKGVPDRDGAALLVNPGTAWTMLDRVDDGAAFVFSAAASQLGKLTAALARDRGKRMIGIVRRDAPVAALRDLGAAHVLNETAADFPDRLREVLARERPRIFLDAVAGGTSPAIFKAMGKGARWIVYGKLDDGPAEILEPGELIFMDKRVEGFWLAEEARRLSLLARLRMSRGVQARFRDGRWSTDVAAEIPLAEVLDRLPQALATPDGKVQIVMPGED